jgi:hypothetical protein
MDYTQASWSESQPWRAHKRIGYASMYPNPASALKQGIYFIIVTEIERSAQQAFPA